MAIPLGLVKTAQGLTPGTGRVLGLSEGDDLAPVFRIEVNDIPIREDIGQFVLGVEYENAIDIADLFKVVISNPGLVDDFYPDWSAHKAFQPGNEASLYFGYGGDASRPENFVGRCVWMKHLPVYPREGMPTLEIKGYDLSAKMMDLSGPVFNAAKIAKLERSRPLDEQDNQGQVFGNILHSDVIGYLADMYGMSKDIDATERVDNVVIKKGMKHFELAKSLANINNRDFWVDYNIRTRRWVMHWKNFDRSTRSQYVFTYNHGDESTLLEAEPEYGLREALTEAVISVFDAENQRWVSAIEVSDAGSVDPIFRLGGGLEQRSQPALNNRNRITKGRSKAEARRQAERYRDRNVIDEAMDNAGAYRISAGGVAIDVLPPGRRFRDLEEAGRYLLRWFKERQDNFIVVRGVTVGVETMRARQVHTLKGLGVRLDGDYFFTRVRHIGSNENGYTCEFTANKVIER